MNMNILILSVGTRNKIVQYFKNELNNKGLIIATDASQLAPALYDADKYYIVPRIDDPTYINAIINICVENKVRGILSLIDPELSILAKHYEDFKKIGVTPIISNQNLIELSFNKYEFISKVKESGFNHIKSYMSLNEFYVDYNKNIIEFPVFVKPIHGSASININKVHNLEELESLFNKSNDLLIQEYIKGREFGADCYIDLIDGEIKSIFVKEKLLMRAGETDKSVSIRNIKLEELITKFLSIFKYRGVIDIDILEQEGEYYISEVNPRFGGGYPHAYEIGINMPRMIINNLENNINDKYFDYEAGIYMMKYNEVKIR